MSSRFLIIAVFLVLIAATVAVVVAPRWLSRPATSPSPAATADAGSAVLVGAGDIALCREEGDEGTAEVLDGIEGTVFTTGDNAYQEGTPEEYDECYDASWGRHRDRTRPTPGNHEYRTPDAEGYFEYFGELAGEPGEGWYSYQLGDWQVIALNSNCDHIAGGCDDGSPQLEWLREELAASDAQCTAAYWHHPRFGSGRHGNDIDVAPFWEALYQDGADVIITGHDHLYERFGPQDPEANADAERGIRQFVVGTGGADFYEFEELQPNSEMRNNDTHGVLKLTLRADSYDWEFVPVQGGTFTDSGSADCH